MKEKHTASKVILVSVLVLFAVTAIIFGASIAKPNDMVTIPRIKTSIISSDNKSHSIEADFSVQLKKGAKDMNQKNIDSYALYKEIAIAIDRLDYQKLCSYNGTEYLKQTVIDQLSKTIPSENVENVYITNIISDYPLPEVKQSNKISTFLQSIFGD